MWRMLIPAVLLAGCAQLPPPPGDAEAKRFDSVPDRSVIYVVRQPVDSEVGRTLSLDDRLTITTWQGTYYRWEVPPGTHRIVALADGTEAVTLMTAPGRIYFVQHTVLSPRRTGTVGLASLQEIGDQAGRNLVSRGQLLR